ncbi:phosphohydrolase [Halosimplex salinum]|nr:phosphohydrolase [Halosimplex salinum]
MPEIQVSDSLYSQLEDASDGRDLDDAMWEMLYLFQRGNNPSE